MCCCEYYLLTLTKLESVFQLCQEKDNLAVMSGYSNTTRRCNHGLYFTLGIRRSLKNTMKDRVHSLNSGKAFVYCVTHYLTLQKLKYDYNDIGWIQYSPCFKQLEEEFCMWNKLTIYPTKIINSNRTDFTVSEYYILQGMGRLNIVISWGGVSQSLCHYSAIDWSRCPKALICGLTR